MPRKPIELAGAQLPLLFVAASFVAAALTQANLQIVNAGKVLKLAKATHNDTVDKNVPARRGSIATSDGKVLAQCLDSYELGISFSKSPQSPGFAVDMAMATGRPASAFVAGPGEERTYKMFQTPLTGAQARAVKAVRKKWWADGVSLVPVLDREYPMGSAASNIVGMMRGDDAITGLERSLNSKLMGKAGKLVGIVDRTGLFLPTDGIKGTEPVDGADIVLTIDSTLQSLAAAALRQAVESHAATRGSVVILDPKTGDILALASWPGYDPEGAIHKGSDLETGTMADLEPGSTFKVLTLAEALDTHAVNTDWHSVCPGQVEVTRGHFVRCDEHHGNRAHGPVDLDGAISRSCNVSAVGWAQAVGRQKMLDMMQKLGLFDKPGTGLPGEVAGFYNVNDKGYVMQLANFGFGQALASTPAALADAYSTLANEGLRMKLRLIKSVNGKETPVEPAGQVFSASTCDLVRSYMRSTVEMPYGTGYALRVDGYTLAGKTGTAQKVGSKSSGHVASFVGFVPAEKTRAVILVMVDNPKKGGYYGAEVAGPVFHDLAKAVIKRLELAPSPYVPVAKSTAIGAVPETVVPAGKAKTSVNARKENRSSSVPKRSKADKATRTSDANAAKAGKVKPKGKTTIRLPKTPASGTLRQ